MNKSYHLFLNRRALHSRQSGVAFLLLIVVLVLSTATLMITQISRNQQTIARSTNTVDAMRLSRDALLGYALSQSVPGVLPCPDADGDGDSDVIGSGCSAVAAWLPFRTLGLDDIRDSSGAKLWYAVDPNYTHGVAPFNSSSVSNLHANNEIAAFVLLAPNVSLDGQVRAPGSTNRGRYFEDLNGDSDPYVYRQNLSEENNDQLLSYTTKQFWTLIENSVVLPEAIIALNNYYASCSAYPWAAAFANGIPDSVDGLQQGGLPLGSVSPSNGGVCSATLLVSSWFYSHWGDQLQYAFCLDSQGQCLTVGGDSIVNTAALVIGPGVPLVGQSRPSVLLSQYFENANQLSTTQFLFRSTHNHDGSFNDVLQYLP